MACNKESPKAPVCNYQPKRCRHSFFHLLVSHTLCALLFNGAYAADAPQNFISKQYSSKNGEIFWDRADRPVVGYEISRNGTILGVFDALSYYDDTIEPGKLYTYTIATVEADGKTRSDIATVQLGQSVDTINEPQPDSPGTGVLIQDMPVSDTSQVDALKNLRVEVYSLTDAEIFWDGDDNPLTVYEIIVNDDDPITTPDNKLYLSALELFKSYTIDIRALNGIPRPFEISKQLRFTTSEHVNEFNPLSNLRVEIYSQKNAEIFWDRVYDNPPRYWINLNGETVGTAENGSPTYATSLYLDNLAPGSRNTVGIQVLQEGVRFKPTSSISFTMPYDASAYEAPGTASPINTQNAETVFYNVLGVIAGNGHKKIQSEKDDTQTLEEISQMDPANPLPGFTLTSNQEETETTELRRSYDCLDGGSLVHTRSRKFGTYSEELTFADCALSGIVRSGRVDVNRGAGLADFIDFYEYTRAEGENSLWLTASRGTRTSTAGENGTSFNDYSRRLESRFKTGTTDERVVGFRQQKWSTRSFLLSNSFSTDFTVDGSWTQGRLLKVQTNRTFGDVDIDNTYFEQGVLRIIDVTARENYIELDASTGESATYRLTVSANGTVSSELRKWDDLPMENSYLFVTPR